MDQENTLKNGLRIDVGRIMQCPLCAASYPGTISYCTADGAKLEESQSAAERTIIFADKYEILDEIGRGGMGAVYRVRQIFLDRTYALKLISPESLNDLLITRFQREATMMAVLDHANLGRVLDFGIFNNQPFLVMEYLDGVPLDKIIAEQPLSVEDAIEIFSQVLDGLAAAHKKGVLHRDIKPSNIMILQAPPAADGQTSARRKAVLLDFGIAKKIDTSADPQMASSQAQALTRTGEMIGSPLYMSPEQARGEKLTERCDLYSLGCALFECLTGTPPFAGKTVVDTLILHMEKTAPSLKEASLGREFPAGLERVMRKLLDKDPGARYQSAEETKRALQLTLQLEEHDQERKPQAPRAKLPVALVLLLAVAVASALAGAAIVNSRHQPEPNRQNISLDNSDALQSALFKVADKKYLQGPEMNSKEIVDEREQQKPTDDNEDESEADSKSVSPYIVLNGKENSLALRGQELEPARVKLIEKNASLTGLGLASARFPHAMLGHLAGKLLALRLTDTGITDSEMPLVARNTTLRILLLNVNHGLTSAGVTSITPLKMLTRLDLSDTAVAWRGIEKLRQLPCLQTLGLANNKQIDDKAAQVLSSLNLTVLSISGTKITGKGIGYLSHIPRLAELNAGGLKLRDNHLTALKNLHELRILRLSDNNITAAGIKKLVPLKHLWNLEIDKNPISDEAIPSLLQLSALRELTLNETNLTPRAIMKLAALPVLQKLWIRRVKNIDDPFVQEFMSKCPSLLEIVYLKERACGYTREEWQRDEFRRRESLKHSAQNP